MSSEPELPGATPRRAEAVATESLADREARSRLLRYVMHFGLPVSVSLVLHAAVIGFLALKTFDVLTRGGIEVGEYEASLIESPADQMDGAFDWAGTELLEMPAEAPLEGSFEGLTALEVPDFDIRELGAAGMGGVGEEGGLGIGDGALGLLGTGSGAGEAGTGGFGSGLGAGGVRIGRAGLWGLRIRADKIVYVVDFSGSIIVAVDELKRELKRSIGRLKPSQCFTVIVFYSTGAGQDERVRTESFKPQLEPADEQTRREFFAWLDRKVPRGATEPLQAIKRALALGPDAVFFFSDGYFEDALIPEIKRANRQARAKIYCLVFDELLLQDTSDLPRETEGARRLKRIAEANGGRVKIVTGKDLSR